MSHRPRLAIASGNRLGLVAAEGVARVGGNAVDAAIASAIMAWVAEPFFASLGGSGFVAVRAPDESVEIFDGNNAMPQSEPLEPGNGVQRVYLNYSDGMHTGIGGGSVAVPGVLAGLHEAWRRHGQIEWEALLEAAINVARDGLPMPRTSAYYLSVTWNEIWSRYPDGAEIFGSDGAPLREGDRLVQGALADALEEVAREGPKAFYGGSLGRLVVDSLAADGGFMTIDDLTSYRAERRVPLETTFGGWKVATTPPPAVGGAVLVHMLSLLEAADLGDPRARLAAVVEAERAAWSYRLDRYKDPSDIAAAFDEMLATLVRHTSPETTHTSASDTDGYVCALTESNGYGSGLTIAGILLNNTLGEEELNPMGAHRLPPGARCHSNMTPTIATGPQRVVALGSPGADRIVGAIAQTLIRLAKDDASLAEAVAAPRAHLDLRPEGERLCYEPGLPGDAVGVTPRPYDEPHMYFGGVQAATLTVDGVVEAAHDPRRSGGSAVIEA